MPRKSHFNDTWLTDGRFKAWIGKKNDTTAFCKYCQKDIPVTNGGEAALKRHAGMSPFEEMGKNHKRKSPVDGNSMKTLFQAASSSSAHETSVGGGDESSGSIPKKQSSIDSILEKDNVLDGETRWCLKVVLSKFSQRSCDDIVELFTTIFYDSEIAKKMTLKRTKVGYCINYGIAPYFEELLLCEIKESPFHVLSFDESLNKKLQKGQMDVLIRFWDSEKNISITRYLTSEFLGGAKADDILQKFETAVGKKIDQSPNLLQISSDGPNVNLKFLEMYNEKRQFNDLPALLNIGTCGLHTMHGSLKAAIKSTDWVMGKVLKAMSNILDETPARREMFEKITETNLYPLQYCGHRWCENENCLQHAELIWPAFIKFIKYLGTLPKSKQPGQGIGKGYLVLRKAINDPLMMAKMKLIEFLSAKLNEFLRGFQTDQPMVPFLAESLENILRSILNMFILSDTMKKADTLMKLIKLDISDKNLFKPREAIDVGMGAKIHVSEYNKSNGFKESTLMSFWKEVQCTLSSLTSHMMEKCPLKYPLVRFAASMNPSIVVTKNKKELSILRFSKLLEKLVRSERITPKEGDEAKEQYFKFIHEIVTSYEEMFLAFDKFQNRLDTFYAGYLSGKEFQALWKVSVLVFCLSHGQSAIERGFKANKEYAVDNQGEITLMSLRMIHDHMQAKDLTAHTIRITKDMRTSVRKSRQRYVEYLKNNKLEKKITEKDLKRKIICEEIQDVQKKRRFLESSIGALRKDADNHALDAAKKKDFQLLERSNGLRSLVSQKVEEIAELDKMEESLLIRKESIV